MKLKEHISIFRRAVKMLFELNRSYMLCTIFGCFVSSLIPYIPIWFSAKLIDAIWAGAAAERIAMYAALTVGLTFLLGLLRKLAGVVEDEKYGVLYREQEWNYSKKEMEMEYSGIESRDVALLLERIRIESQTGYNLWYLTMSVRNLIWYTTSILASLSLILSFFLLDAVPAYGKLGLVAGILLNVFCEIYSTTRGEKIKQDFFKTNVHLNLLGNKYSECFSDYSMGMDIRLYAMGERISGSKIETDMKYCADSIKIDIKCGLLSLPGVVLNHLLRFGAYLVLISAAAEGAVSIGSIAKYVACTMLLLEAIAKLAGILQKAAVNNRYLKRYFSYFDIPNNMYQGTLTVEKRLDTEYYVEFRDVSFRYPNTENYALRHINLKFRVGEKLAVVGMNGSGKTTFIKLLCRLYDPTEGEILLNGVNIKKYDYDEYMSIFSVVFQDFQLFAFTVGQNVAAAKEYDEERAARCLARAGFGERLSGLPAGLETWLYKDYEKDGVEISGGEAQKIALARALYKDAPFIVLDEPTAALDPVSEYEVYSKFNELAGEKTAIYISHRLASCRFCDSIAVFDKGSIVQRGSHEVLLADAGGKYSELWNAQAQYYTEQTPACG
ncbi:MAG: ABC transporter ATP-binding protein/permease [Lachnospiraceae bacterium]|nr:ABC transporter ATP-binding protein/permease [Lachnospiraceae bacterium]